jgi:hypothetical protein
MQRVKDGVDFSTFICPVEAEFIPRLNDEHDSFMRADPTTVLDEANMAVAEE